MSSLPSWIDRAAYPFELRRQRLADGELSFVDAGSGPVLLFVHGTPTWSFEYRHLIAGLSTSFRCVAPDHLGFGLSERPAGASYTPESHAARLEQLVSALDLRDITLVVHDFGGPIGLPLGLGDRVKRLVVFNTFAWPVDDVPHLARGAKLAGGFFGRFLYRRLNASLKLLMPSVYGDCRKLTPAIHAQYLSVFPDADSRERVLWALARALLQSRQHYARLWSERARLQRLPALLLWGMKDTAFGPRELQRCREMLPGAKVVDLESAGHWPHEEEPARVLAELRAWL